ncbi:MAG: glycosyltransferase family 39 protein [Cyanobacteria bacterium SZAS TMP-1]|nr:glycosyltransferase family 39 protein [Cyanobacteria bacterium SZAS TMP-1]
MSKQCMILTAVVVAGLALRLYHLNDHGLFVDEVYSVLVATGTGDPELMQFDASRPLYFWLLNLWHMLGSGDGWLRTFSVIFGSANIALIYFLGKLAGGPRAALAAALIMALSPMEIHYSQQVRMYTLGTFFVLGGTIALLKAFAGGSKLAVMAWALARLLMVLTLPLTVVLLAVDLLFAVFQTRAARKAGGGHSLLPLMAVCAAAVALCWTPFLLILLKAQSSPYDSWRSTLDNPNLLDYLTLLINFTASAIPLQESGGPPMYGVFADLYVVLFPLVLAFGLALCRREKYILWLALWGFLPLTALFIYSNFRPPLFITRYSMFTAPFVYLILGYAWSEIYQRKRVIGLTVGAVYILGMGTFIGHFFQHPVHEDWREIAAFIGEHEKSGDEIIVWNYHSKYLLGYYYKGKNRISDLQVNRAENQNGLLVNLELVPPPKPGQRLWIITREAAPGWHRMREVYEEFQAALEGHYKVLQHSHLTLSDVYELQEP